MDRETALKGIMGQFITQYSRQMIRYLVAVMLGEKIEKIGVKKNWGQIFTLDI